MQKAVFIMWYSPVKLVHASISATKGLEDNFHNCGGPVTLVHACFSDLESSFDHCGSPVKLVNGSLRVRKYSKSSFHHCGGPMKLQQGSLSVSRDLETSFDH